MGHDTVERRMAGLSAGSDDPSHGVASGQDDAAMVDLRGRAVGRVQTQPEIGNTFGAACRAAHRLPGFGGLHGDRSVALPAKAIHTSEAYTGRRLTGD